ncbi:MAG: hypothetical protein ACKUBY_03145 [Candidatus Moraniibacteriota bacterium]
MCLCGLLLAGCSDDSVDSDTIGYQRPPTKQLVQFLDDMDQWIENQPEDISSEQFLVEVYRIWPDIDQEILQNLRAEKVIAEGELPRIEYHFFKDGKCDMQDEDGAYVPVRLVRANKFALRLIREGVEDSWISLACLNGMLNLDRESDVNAIARMEFEIGPGKGLSYYTQDNLLSIRIAEVFGLWLFEGKGYNKRITPEKARDIVTAVKQVTVKVKTGWKFRINGIDDMQIFLPQEDWMSPEEFKQKH